MAPAKGPAPTSLYKDLTASETMRKCMITDKKYIPQQKLLEIVTVSKVKTALRSRRSWLRLSLRHHGLNDKLLQARKLIAVLVIIGQLNEDSLKSLASTALTDNDLPLCANGDRLQTHHKPKTVVFPKWEEATVAAFLEKQWIVLAPILDFKGKCPIEVELDKECALEFSECFAELPKNRVTVPDADAHSKGNGGNPYLVAIKKFKSAKSLHDYEHERDNLREIYGIDNNHLVKHLATRDQIRCIIFPWAIHGDLKQFWEDRSASARELPMFIWFIEQLAGLASALRELHKINCRHGDLKPSNIFYFSEKDTGVLKIADVGISRVHQESTDQREKETVTTASTRAYEGPEASQQTLAPRSRTYDCWSMGCIILEFIIWLLYDQQALNSFRWSRDSTWNSYYRVKNLGPTSQNRWWEGVERHPSTDKAIKLVLKDARVRGTALQELVNLVDSKLLLINPKQRLLAADLAERLKGLLGRCKRGQTPWVHNNEVRPTVPPIFRQERPKAPDTTF
ncbi:kinase domain containing [Fusarium albosuccineum]|uniref:Kinase domain containing n=1 Tax=Fusarium albosuccineum TaxID=1237068 RepID=A0A8H4LGJ9_9HYPO|nr:kinase domain containing [Fusarium albosuccineum]